MKFKVHGIDPTTGQERDWEMTAKNEKAATEKANTAGWRLTRITQAGPTTGQKVAREAERTIAELIALTAFVFGIVVALGAVLACFAESLTDGLLACLIIAVIVGTVVISKSIGRMTDELHREKGE